MTSPDPHLAARLDRVESLLSRQLATTQRQAALYRRATTILALTLSGGLLAGTLGLIAQDDAETPMDAAAGMEADTPEADMNAADDEPDLELPIIDVLQMRRLEIINDDGSLVAALGVDPGSGSGQIDVWSNTGANVVRIAANNHGGDIALWNAAGNPVGGLYTIQSGGALGLWDQTGARALRADVQDTGGRIEVHSNGQSAAAMTCTPDGGRIDVHDGGGSPSVTALNTASGGELFTRASSGQRTAILGNNAQGGQLTINSAAGDTAAEIRAVQGGGIVTTANPQGTTVTAMGPTNDGAGIVLIKNATGENRIIAQAGGNVGSVDIFNAASQRTLALGNDANGGTLAVHHHEGNPAITAAAQPDGAALTLTAPGGNKLFEVAGDDQGNILSIYNGYGVPVVLAGHDPDARHGRLTTRNGRGVDIIHLHADEAEAGRITIYNQETQKPRHLKPVP